MNIQKTYNYYIIYETKSFENKSYIGWHATNKLDDGYLGSGKILENKIASHGKNNFYRIILEFCDFNNVLEREKYWIKKRNTIHPNGYNLTKGGDGKLSPASEKTKKLMSNQRRGVKQIDRFIKVYGEIEGKKRYDIYIEKQKKSRKGRKVSEETKRKLSEAHIGKKKNPMTKEHKQKISESLKGHAVSSESRKKSSESQKGKNKSRETKEKMRLAKLGKKRGTYKIKK